MYLLRKNEMRLVELIASLTFIITLCISLFTIIFLIENNNYSKTYTFLSLVEINNIDQIFNLYNDEFIQVLEEEYDNIIKKDDNHYIISQSYHDQNVKIDIEYCQKEFTEYYEYNLKIEIFNDRDQKIKLLDGDKYEKRAYKFK